MQTTPRIGPLVVALVLAGTLGVLMPTLDERDQIAQATAVAQARADALAQRRVQMAHVSLCHRAFGPQTAPAEDAEGNLVCLDARGHRAAPLAEVASR